MIILKAEGPVRRQFKKAKCENMWEQKKKAVDLEEWTNSGAISRM